MVVFPLEFLQVVDQLLQVQLVLVIYGLELLDLAELVLDLGLVVLNLLLEFVHVLLQGGLLLLLVLYVLG
jgi:hypothetical protein